MTEDELVLNAQHAEDAAAEDVSGMARTEAAFWPRVYMPATHVPLRDGAQHAAERVRPEHAARAATRGTATHDLCDPGRAADVAGVYDDDDMGLESVSDPKEEAVDTGADDGEGSMWFFDEGSLSASHGVSSSVSHTNPSTHYHNSNANSTTSSARTRSEEADTEEDPVAPITPLPTTTWFDLSGRPKAQDGAGEKGTKDMAATPRTTGAAAAGCCACAGQEEQEREREGEGGKEKKEKKRKTKKAAAVLVPSVHYPFPVSAEDGASGGGQQQHAEEWEWERQRNVTVSPRPTAQGRSDRGRQGMHTARARNGGRTQNGGVCGVLTTDD
ncbi:hypothetical protein C8J57DRAFT_1244914 [Mycena rebaudengoi]|nr:hypothetical protein C8J57DRAFT_1244914 [Mycena rebaudengoi]